MNQMFKVGDNVLGKINTPYIIKDIVNNQYTVMDKNGCLFQYNNNELIKRDTPMYKPGEHVKIIHKYTKSKIEFNDGNFIDELDDNNIYTIKKITYDYYTLITSNNEEFDAHEDQFINIENYIYNYNKLKKENIQLKNKIQEQKMLLNDEFTMLIT